MISNTRSKLLSILICFLLIMQPVTNVLGIVTADASASDPLYWDFSDYESDGTTLPEGFYLYCNDEKCFSFDATEDPVYGKGFTITRKAGKTTTPSYVSLTGMAGTGEYGHEAADKTGDNSIVQVRYKVSVDKSVNPNESIGTWAESIKLHYGDGSVWGGATDAGRHSLILAHPTNKSLKMYIGSPHVTEDVKQACAEENKNYRVEEEVGTWELDKWYTFTYQSVLESVDTPNGKRPFNNYIGYLNGMYVGENDPLYKDAYKSPRFNGFTFAMGTDASPGLSYTFDDLKVYKDDKALTAVLDTSNAEAVPIMGGIKVKFSNPLSIDKQSDWTASENIGKIKLYKGGTEVPDFTTVLSDDFTEVTLDVDGGFDPTSDYSVKFDGVADMFGKTPASTTLDFTTDVAPEFTVSADIPQTGVALDSSFDVKFSLSLNTEDSNLAKIKLIDDNGHEVSCIRTLSENNTKVNVKPAMNLNSTSDYKIVVDNVANRHGTSVSDEFTFITADIPRMVYDIDFEVNEGTGRYTLGAAGNDVGIVTGEDGNRYYQITRTAEATGTSTFDISGVSETTSSIFQIKFRLDENGEGNILNTGWPNTLYTGYLGTTSLHSPVTLVQKNDVRLHNPKPDGWVEAKGNADDNKWYTLTYVAFEDSEGNLDFKGYLSDNGEIAAQMTSDEKNQDPSQKMSRVLIQMQQHFSVGAKYGFDDVRLYNKCKYLKATLSESENVNITSPIVVNFDAPIDPETASTIKLLDKDSKEVSVASSVISDDFRTVTLSASDELVALSDYTVKVGGVIDLLGSPVAADNNSLAFETAAAPQIEVSAEIPSTNVELNAAFDLKFSRALNTDAANLSKIKLLDENGQEVICTRDLSEGNSKVTLTPAALLNDSSDYKIVVDNVANKTNDSTVSNEFSFSTAAKERVVFSQDFESVTKTTGSDLFNETGFVRSQYTYDKSMDGDTPDYRFEKMTDASGNDYLEMEMNVETNPNGIRPIINVDNVQNAVVQYKVKYSYGGSTAFSWTHPFYVYTNGSARNLYELRSDNLGLRYCKEYETDKGWATADANYKDEWHSVTYVIMRDNTGSYIKHYFNGKLLYTTTPSATDLKLTKVEFAYDAKNYTDPKSTKLPTGFKYAIDDVAVLNKCKYVNTTLSATEEVEVDGSVTVTFDSPLEPTSFSNIKVTDKNSKEIGINVTPSADLMSATITPKSTFTQGALHTIDYTGVVDVFGSTVSAAGEKQFRVKTIPTAGFELVDVSVTDEGTKGTVRLVNNTDEAVSGILYAAAYTNEKFVGTDIIGDIGSVAGNGGEIEKDFSIDTTGYKDKYFKLKFFLWGDKLQPSVETGNFSTTDVPKFWIMGDSIAQTYNGSIGERFGWGEVIGDRIVSPIRINNNAVAGTSTKTFYDTVWTPREMYQNIQPGDYVIIAFGHNDGMTTYARATHMADIYDENIFVGEGENMTYNGEKVYTDNEGLHYTIVSGNEGGSGAAFTVNRYFYMEMLEHYIKLVREKGAIPIITTSIPELRTPDSETTWIQSVAAVPYAKKVAAADTEGILFIDVYEEFRNRTDRAGYTGEQLRALYTLVDNVHLTETGARLVADIICDGILASDLTLKEFIKKAE